MISGVSGVRGDVIPFGLARRPAPSWSASTWSGLRRRGFSRATCIGCGSAYRALFFGAGDLSRAARRGGGANSPAIRWSPRSSHSSAPGKSRPLMMPPRVPAATAWRRPRRMMRAAVRRAQGRPARDHLRRPAISVCGRRRGRRGGRRVRAVCAAGLGPTRQRSRAIRIIGSRSARPGAFAGLARREGCRDVVFIGRWCGRRSGNLRLDLTTLRLLPRIIRGMFRGGDDHLLSGVADRFEEHGFRLGRRATRSRRKSWCRRERRPYAPSEQRPCRHRARACADRRDRAVRHRPGRRSLPTVACSPVEAAEGTDHMLARGRELRRAASGDSPTGGVLVKAPKPGQDRRFDLPSVGPHGRRARRAPGSPASRSSPARRHHRRARAT